MSIQALMSEFNTTLSLTNRAAVVRPFGLTEFHRPDTPMPVSPLPSNDNKRKMFAISDYDSNLHPNAPIRLNFISRPFNGWN
jgi:hypothetical protein